MTEDMQAAWLEIEQMLGEATREEFDVFLRTWQRAVQATRKTLAQPDFWQGYVPEPVKPAQQCKWPTCQSEEYQQALAEQIKRELVGEQPAQRTWVGLTEPERLACYDLNPARFASAIEAKLKEKNT
ncbi:MAG: hypothetical protein ACOVN5_04690 [Aquidulcibacter sp.]|jgi:hypothetical protein